MLVVAFTFAACYGVLQLAVLTSPVRTVGVGTLLLAVGVGMYGCGVLAVLAEFGYTRAVSALTGDRLYEVVPIAGHTIDPFIEEVAKVLPLLIVGLYVRTRTQWGLADYLLVGAGTGAGFGLLEAVMRYADRADDVLPFTSGGGWLLPVGLSVGYIPGPGATLSSWLPAPISGGGFALFPEGPDLNLHLVWSAVAGAGIGYLLRASGLRRLLGIVPLVLVGADHAAHNYDLNATAHNAIGDVIATPFLAAKPMLGLWPVLAVVFAVVLDLRWLRRARAAHPDLALARERGSLVNRVGVLAGYALHKPPWTTLLATRFVRLRRAALYGDIRPAAAEPMLDLVRGIRSQLDATDSAAAWKGRGLRAVIDAATATGRSRRLRRFAPLILWAVLVLPSAAYFLVGTTPWAAGVQGLLGSTVVFPIMVGLTVAGLLWIAWGLLAAIAAVPAAVRSPDGSAAARLQLKVAIAAGALVVGAVSVTAWLTGTGPTRPLISNFHVLDALSDLLLVGGLALLLAAFIFFPPAGFAVTTLGTAVLVPTLTTGFVTLGTLGVTSVLLSQATSSASQSSGGGSGQGGSSGGQNVPDMPQKPPAPKPQVQHWRLRNIVDSLYKGTRTPNRIGDGTTMDAVRNELATGRPTNGMFHSDKAREAVNGLDNWIRRFGPQASRTDRLEAWRIRSELIKALSGQ